MCVCVCVFLPVLFPIVGLIGAGILGFLVLFPSFGLLGIGILGFLLVLFPVVGLLGVGIFGISPRAVPNRWAFRYEDLVYQLLCHGIV